MPAAAPVAAADVPAAAHALAAGYAVRAEETLGAAPYNPLSFALTGADRGVLPRGAAAPVAAGQALPDGADAVLPGEVVEADGEHRLGVLAMLAEGDGVVAAASELGAGEPLWPTGERCRPLRPAEIGLLAAAGVERLLVVRRPRTRILAAGASEALRPMLQALVARDGGVVIEPQHPAGSPDLAAGADVVLIAGTIDGSLETAIRGVALEPGRETCVARLQDTTVVVLPGLPAACFWAYELIAGRVVRRRGGRDPGLPYATRRLRTTRKIVSGLGLTEVVPVRFDASQATVLPLPGGRAPRLRTAAAADGFTLMPANSEGAPAGSLVTVWLFDAARDAGGG